MADFQYKVVFDQVYPNNCSPHLYRQARRVAADHGLIRETNVLRFNPTTRRWQMVWEACNEGRPKKQRCPHCGHVSRRKNLTVPVVKENL
jgi:hypothetical protein